MIALVPALATYLAGCPSAGPGTGEPTNTNDNGTPGLPLPDDVEIEVTVDGQGLVEQESSGGFVTLTAIPEPDWRFDGWFGSTESSTNPLMIRPDDSTDIGARFVVGSSQNDADADGVSDGRDQCPATLDGADVDAVGCALSQLDGDDDGVTDDADQCPQTPSGALIDAQGCAASQVDDDGDGVMNNIDGCPGTPSEASVNPLGCADSQLDSDGDGVMDDVDQCASTPAATPVNDVGCPPECGNEVIEAGEVCDPPDGITCGNDCLIIIDTGPDNNDCSSPKTVTDGGKLFDTTGASTDGTDESGDCDELGADVWFCYEASCSGEVSVDACNSDYDTILAVYDGCSTCPPTGSPTPCDDDGCGVTGGGSKASFQGVSGSKYLIRVGGWDNAVGEGILKLSCDDGGGGDPSCQSNAQCNDSNSCTTDTCNVVTGCEYTAVDCDDADVCTDDSCDSATGCVHHAIDCDDGNPCTDDSCDPANGCEYTDVACSGNFVCDPSTGACVLRCLIDADCEDNDLCTYDTCVDLMCSRVPVKCPVDYYCVDGECVR